jgi:hypothetical protein
MVAVDDRLHLAADPDRALRIDLTCTRPSRPTSRPWLAT